MPIRKEESQSQKLYNVTCEIQQIGCHVNDLIKNTCPDYSAYVSVHLLALSSQVAFLTKALVGSHADTSMSASWLTLCWEEKQRKKITLVLQLRHKSPDGEA